MQMVKLLFAQKMMGYSLYSRIDKKGGTLGDLK